MFLKIALLMALVMVLDFGNPIEGARILAFLPFPIKSHHRVAQPLLRALAVRGHNVTSVTPFPLEDPPPNYREVLVEDFHPEIKAKVDLRKFDKLWPWQLMSVVNTLKSIIKERIYKSERMQEILGWDEEFDAVIDSSPIMQESSAVLEHRFGAVGIILLPLGSSHHTNFMVGNPTNPSYMLDITSPYPQEMKFFQRVGNTLICIMMAALPWFFNLPPAQEIADSYLRYPGWEGRPSIAELMANKSLVLVNSHFSTNYAEPSSPHVIGIGGINIPPEKPLPEDIQKYMDEAEDGVVYFSLGGNMDVSEFLRGDLLKAFLGPLGKLKQRVLWKWEDENFPGQPDNVKTSKWFPQYDILRHKNCKLFISHGGYMSLTEAVHSGVPIVGIPLFGDQRKNLLHVVSNRYGVMIETENITEASISWAVNEVLSDPTYREAAQARSKIFRDRPMSPADTAVYWIEYVIRHRGAPHLKTQFSKLSWYQSSLIDVAVFLISVILFVFWLSYRLIRCAIVLICGKKPSATIKKKKQ